MKTNLIYLNSRKLVALLLGALLSLTLSAQVDWTGSELVVPTEDGILLVDDMTVYSLANSIHADAGGPASSDGNGAYEVKNDLIEYLTANDYFEYQVIAVESGQYAITLPVSSKNADSKVNVSAYLVDGTFVMDGTTTVVGNGQWQTPVDYIFPFDLEAGKVYNLRVTIVNSGCNIFNDGLTIESLQGPIDATLKDIAIDGVTIPGFSPDVFEYTIALEPYEWVDSLTADANDFTATVEVPEIPNPDTGVKASAEIKCTSLGGIIITYTVNIIKPLEVYEEITLGFYDADVYANNGVNMKASKGKINSTNNNSYVEYYIYSAYDDNMSVTLSCTNGFIDSESYLNVSTLAVYDSTWTLQDRYSQRVPISYSTADPTVGEWNNALCVPNDVSFIIQLKQDVPVRLRIYCITDQSNCADIYGITFDRVTESIDNTLSDLTIDGVTIADFDTAVTNYTVPLSAGTTQVEIGATANDTEAEVTSGVGTFDIINGTAEIVCNSVAGYPLTYRITFVTPKAILVGDTLVLGDDVYTTSSDVVRASNVRINWFADSMYVDYFIYSETDADMHVTMLAANGNKDTVYSKVNISTYSLGTDWSSEMGITKDIERVEVDMWTVDYATEEEYNISLVANEAVMLRVFAFTNSYINVADIYKLTFNDAHTTAGGEDDGLPASIEDVVGTANVSVISGTGSLSVIGDETMLGASVTIFDISGRLVVNKIANSTNESFTIDQSGLYIVRVVSPAKAVSTIKCVVR